MIAKGFRQSNCKKNYISQSVVICSQFVDKASMVIKTCWVLRGSCEVRVPNFLKERVVRAMNIPELNVRAKGVRS